MAIERGLIVELVSVFEGEDLVSSCNTNTMVVR